LNHTNGYIEKDSALKQLLLLLTEEGKTDKSGKKRIEEE